MSGRHRPYGRPASRSGRSIRTPIAIGGVAALVALTAIAVHAVAADAKGCSTGVRLSVAAAPDVTPAVQEAAARWVASSPRVGGDCVRVQVTAVQPADLANTLAVRAGGRLNLGADAAPTPTEADLPAVWIPDSVSWIGRVQAVDRDVFDDTTPSVAMSPIVLAMPEAVARTLQGPGARPLNPNDLGMLLQRLSKGDRTLQIGVAEPRRDSASLAGAVLLHDTVVTTPAQLPLLVGAYRAAVRVPDRASLLKGFGSALTVAPMSEQAVLDFDATSPAVPLAAAQFAPAFTLDYPYAILSGRPRAIARAAELFRTALIGPNSRDIFARHGFRAPDGTAPPGFPIGHGATGEQALGSPLNDAAHVSDVLSIWSNSITPSRVLALIDVTASMNQPMTMPNGATVTRARVVQQTSIDGLKLFSNDSELGRWEYALGLSAGRDYREVVPVGELNAAHRAKLNAAIAAAQPSANDFCGLYDTLLAAYKAMKDGYRADRSNTIVVFIDGRNSKPGGMSLDDFGIELEKLADPTKPIRVILLGVGPDVDLAELNTIAKDTGGKAFQVDDPTKIGLIFLNALLRA